MMRISISNLLNIVLLCGIITLLLLLHQISSTSSSNVDKISPIRKESLPAKVEEKVVIKEIEIIKEVIREVPVQSKLSSSHLHPGWPESVLQASDSISFQKMKFSVPEMGIEARFWYPVEETLHSANYIMTQEILEVKWWINTLEKTKKALGKCNVLDIGSNGGFFSLLSRRLDCNVLAVDAQPWCLTRLSSGAVINGFTDKISTRWAAVSDSPNLTISVGATKCSGLWAVKNSEWINEESKKSVSVNSATCASIVRDWLPEEREIINLMKIDAEGSEIGIIRSALPLLKSHRILNILTEFVPGRTKNITPFRTVNDTLTQLYDAGYICSTMKSGIVVDVSYLQNYFDPTNTQPGRNTPEMWKCNLVASKSGSTFRR